MSKSHDTPLMNQYRELKNRYRDGILLFQVGDFYETFYEDARELSRILGIALTSRDKKNPIPLAGVPIHAAETYIARLLAAGKKVVVCDQVEKPSQARGLVRREVTDIITPGTSLSPVALPDNQNNYIASAILVDGICGFAVMDLSTGEFCAAEEHFPVAERMLSGLPVRETILLQECDELVNMISRALPDSAHEPIPGLEFEVREARRLLREQFGSADLSCYGIENKPYATAAAGALLSHVQRLRRQRLEHITGIRLLVPEESLHLDSETLRNLEIFEPLRKDAPVTSLLDHIDRTNTAAGGRELRAWLMRPSRSLRVIEARLDVVEALHAGRALNRRLREMLRGLPDIERLLARITGSKAGPRELLSLADALERMPGIADCCAGLETRLAASTLSELRLSTAASDLVRRSIEPDCPSHLREGGVIRRGFDPDLDKLITDAEEGKRWIASLQDTERTRTGIPSLKVGFNRIFGYYLEVSRIHLDKVPQDYAARQTLVSSQRYVTPELKEREQKILAADERRVELEKSIFARVCEQIALESAVLQRIAKAAAVIDVLASLADLALEMDYCRPEMNESNNLVINAGRHPVVERLAASGFIPNDLILGPHDRQLLIITGPNMGGKSTYIRQAALIAILAHMGSFVPASSASIGIIDRIFTRVGSSDNLARGQSTFLVEMAETARILHGCTSKSLILLDEVGRGTSTLDGLSIAWAVTEHLVEDEGRRPKTLFATHYHELTDLALRNARIHNLKVEVKEWGDSILFLYRIVDGASDRSYGIHVARLAGLPAAVVQRAREILDTLEKEIPAIDTVSVVRRGQLPLFQTPQDPLYERLAKIDPERITPMQALELLTELKNSLQDASG